MSLEPRSRSLCEELRELPSSESPTLPQRLKGSQDGDGETLATATDRSPSSAWGQSSRRHLTLRQSETRSEPRRGRPVRWRPDKDRSESAAEAVRPVRRASPRPRVFSRLYRDASSKQEALAQWAQDKERREAFAHSMQASEKAAQEICERLHKEQRKQPCAQEDSQKYIPVQESATASATEQRIFLRKQKNWREQRERRMQAQREEHSEAERKYLEEHSIHKKVSKESVSDVLACCHRLYKDGWQRTRRLQRLQESAQEELCLSIEADQVHRAAVAPAGRGRAASAQPRAAREVACRLHQDSEDRRRRVEQKRREQDEFIRQQARPKKDRTPTPSVSPRRTQRAETDRKANSRPQSPATATTATASPMSAVSPVSSGTSTSARSSRLPGEKGSFLENTKSAAARALAETEPLRVDIEVGVVGLLDGASGVPGPGCLKYCEVLTRGLTLMRTRAVESFVWDESVCASILTTDTLLFKIYAVQSALSDRCLAEASLEVKSILRLCSSGFEGKLRMWCQSEASCFPCEPYLHVTLRSGAAGVQQGVGPASSTTAKNSFRQMAHRACPQGVQVQAEAEASTAATTAATASQARKTWAVPSPSGHAEQLRYPCRMSRQIEVMPRTADEDGLLASSSTFLPLRKKLGGCEFEVCMLLPEAVRSPSPCFRVQIPGEWLPEHLREPHDQEEQEENEHGEEEALFFIRQGPAAAAHQVQFELPSQVTRLTTAPRATKAPPQRASPSDSLRGSAR
ncbi:unnamed protein product, partial [Symbiodinium sp. KB8]